MVQKILSVGVLLLISVSSALSSGIIEEGCKAFINSHESTAHVKVGDRMFQGETKCSDVYAFGSSVNKTIIRLVGGNSSKEGRVEVLHQGEWGTVCDDRWGQNDATVVCRMLGFLDAHSAPDLAKFGEGNGRIWLDEIGCTESEDDIAHCKHKGWGEHNCHHREDASAVCNPIEVASGDMSIRLVDGYGSAQGRIEIRENSKWRTICDDYWDVKDAEVVCRMLGYGAAKSAPGRAYFGEGDVEMLQRAYHCQGNESHISECDKTETGFTCQHSECASVICHDNKSTAACEERDCSGLCKFVEVEGKLAIECYRVSREGTCLETLPETFVNITDPCKDKEESTTLTRIDTASPTEINTMRGIKFAGSSTFPGDVTKAAQSSAATPTVADQSNSESSPANGGPAWIGWVIGILIGIIFGIVVGCLATKIFQRNPEKKRQDPSENVYELEQEEYPQRQHRQRNEKASYQVAGEIGAAGGGNPMDMRPDGGDENYGMTENALYGMH